MADNEVKQQTVASSLRAFKASMPRSLKATARGSTRLYGRATSWRRTLPNFLIIGTKRGGTTSLWNALINHEHVLPLFPRQQELKSPHYFDINYHRGEAWYRSFFPTRWDRRKSLQLTGKAPIAGEASPYYMFHPLAAERIANDLPDVKLIVSLRNPVDRAWSHYNERVAGHTETLPFVAALDAEASRISREEDLIVQRQPAYYSFHHDLSTYLARGRYWEHLQAFSRRFGPDQLLILRAEDFYSDPVRVLSNVADFLGLDVTGFGRMEHYNRIPRDTLDPTIREWLTEYYRPSVAELESALGRSFTWDGFTG